MEEARSYELFSASTSEDFCYPRGAEPLAEARGPELLIDGFVKGDPTQIRYRVDQQGYELLYIQKRQQKTVDVRPSVLPELVRAL